MSKYVRVARELPKDPVKALVTFAERALEVQNADGKPMSLEDSEFVMQFIQKFTAKFAIKIPTFENVTDSESEKAFSILAWIKANKEFEREIVRIAISSEVDDIINEFLDEQDQSFGLARLNEEERTKIHIQIKNIREIIASSVLSDRKKNALYERLNRLASEVDAHGTRTDRFFSFMGDVAFVMSDMAEKAKPLFNEVKEMMRILARSRARQEGVSLPPGDDVILLPKPSDEI